MKKFLFLVVAAAVLGCHPDLSDEPPGGSTFDKTGYRPIYQSNSEVKNILVGAPIPLKDPGKIYLFEPYLFINERGKGLHIIDNSDPKNPENISFISIPANFDMAVKGNWLYADNASDLVVLEISDPRLPKVVKRISGAIPAMNYPPYANVYFECIDTKKGVVTGWEKVNMETKPACYR